MSVTSDINDDSKTSISLRGNNSFHSDDSKKENAFISTNYLQASKTCGKNVAILSEEDLLAETGKSRDISAAIKLRYNDTMTIPEENGKVSAILSEEDLMNDADDQVDKITTNSSKTATTIANKGITMTVNMNFNHDKESDDAKSPINVQLNTKDVNATALYSDQSDNKSKDSKSITDNEIEDPSLFFIFREKKVPVSYQSYLTHETVSLALSSKPFLQWVSRTSRIIGTKCFHIHEVTIDSISFASVSSDNDSDGSSRSCSITPVVESMNIKAHCTMDDEDLRLKAQSVPGKCSLKGDSIGILVKLNCVEDDTQWALLVDQPSLSIGAVSSLSLPEGTADIECGDVGGTVVRLIEDACNLRLNSSTMINLTEKAFEMTGASRSISYDHGICPSSGSCSEFIQIMSIEKDITKMELQNMRCQLSELRERGNMTTLRVVPIADIWKISTDMKVMCALFLMEKITKAEAPKIPSIGRAATFDENGVLPRFGALPKMLGSRRAASFEDSDNPVRTNNPVMRNRFGVMYKDLRKNFFTK